MKSYIRVSIYTNEYTSSHNLCMGKELFLPTVRGNYSEQDVLEKEAQGAIVLEQGVAGNRIHYKPRNEKRMLMFGGSFVYCSDSRFPHETPIAIHDALHWNN